MSSLQQAPWLRNDLLPTKPASCPLGLPPEVWLLILRCLLIKCPEQRDGDTAVVISPLSDWTGRDSSDNRLSGQVLRTNRMIYGVGVEILYSENIFDMNGDDVWVLPNFLSRVAPSNVSRIRHLRLNHRNSGYEDCRGSPHRHDQDQDVVYVYGWLRDVWVDRLFETFPALKHLDSLSIAVDLPSRKMHDDVARMGTRLYFEESGLIDKLRAAKLMRDRVQFRLLVDQVILYINHLGILRAATSLDQLCSGLNAKVYYGLCAHGANGIFSVKELETLTSVEEQRATNRLRAVSL
jgi:hypothetical protein